jgi:capsular exopolysaccharide synthesis family protein
VSKQVKVRALQESNVLAISFLSTSPELAAATADSVAEAYVAEIQALKISAVRQGLERMAGKAQQEGKNLEDAEKSLYAYMEANDLLGKESRSAMASEELSEVSSSLIRAEIKRKELEVLVRKIKAMKRNRTSLDSLPSISSDPTLRAIQAQILESEKSIQELSSNYGPKHPVMKKAQNDLSLLKERKSAQVNRVVTGFFNEYDMALSNERFLREKMRDVRRESLDTNEKYVKYEALLREVETNQKLYAALLIQMKEQNVTAENQNVNVWVLENATTPDAPTRPLVAINLSLGFMIGLLLAILSVFIREYFDLSIVSPDDAEKILGVPVLGVVPRGRGNGVSAEEVLLKESFSIRADSYKALRTSVNLSLDGAWTSSHTILVTSPGSGDGKTVTALNLAYSMAQVDLKVLVVDADMRRPSIHEALGLKNDLGLSTYLERESGLKGSEHVPKLNGDGTLQEGPLDNLTIMTSGPIPPNPSELLTNGNIDKLLEILANRFNVVIFDSPPLISVPDSRILCSNFDATILVARSGVTTAEMAHRAIRMLKDSKAEVIGSVLNSYNQKSANAYYDNYYPSTYRREPAGLSKA